MWDKMWNVICIFSVGSRGSWMIHSLRQVLRILKTPLVSTVKVTGLDGQMVDLGYLVESIHDLMRCLQLLTFSAPQFPHL